MWHPSPLVSPRPAASCRPVPSRPPAAYNALCLEWYVPKGVAPARGGWQVQFTYFEGALRPSPAVDDFATVPFGSTYDSRAIREMSTAAEVTVNTLVRYESSPEWFSSRERPLQLASRAGTIVSKVYFSEAQTPFEGQTIIGRVGVMVNAENGGIVIRVRDRNEDDFVDILPIDDPGMPNGAALYPEVFNAAGKKCHAKIHNIPLGPGRPLFQRTFQWTPTADQIGRHKVGVHTIAASETRQTAHRLLSQTCCVRALRFLLYGVHDA